MKVEIYSDVVCPWCYIGKSRFDEALAEFGGRDELEVVFKPYQLDPEAASTGEPMYDYLERRFGAGARSMTDRVVEMGRAEGLTLDFGRGVMANTFDAHRLLWLVEREAGAEAQRLAATALFEAHFTAGKDISDEEVLVGIGVGAGVEAARIRGSLGSEEGAEEVRGEIAAARRLGITAVPTFVLDGRYAVQGAQPASAFLQALETASSAAAER